MNSYDSTIINSRSGRIYGTSSYSSIVNGTELSICCSNHVLISGRQNSVLSADFTFLFSQGSYIGGNSHHSIIGGGFDNKICNNSSCSSIIAGCGNTIYNSKNSVIIGGSAVFLNSQNDVVYVPSLMSGPISSTASSTWKFGATASSGSILSLVTDQYIEISINGASYKLAIVQ
jgi:hypothetical protein